MGRADVQANATAGAIFRAYHIVLRLALASLQNQGGVGAETHAGITASAQHIVEHGGEGQGFPRGGRGEKLARWHPTGIGPFQGLADTLDGNLKRPLEEVAAIEPETVGGVIGLLPLPQPGIGPLVKPYEARQMARLEQVID